VSQMMTLVSRDSKLTENLASSSQQHTSRKGGAGMHVSNDDVGERGQ
jgi:hypothetical protein